MTDRYPYTLASRISRSVDDARQGMAVMVRIEESERAEAERLVGDAPVIICTHTEGMAFLAMWMKPIFGPKSR